MWICVSALKMIYHSLFHSVMAYGVMFWRNLPHSPVIFKMFKRVIKILMGSGFRESCRGLFMELKILTLTSQYIFSLLLFVVLNRGYFAPNSVYCNFNTRQKNELHLPHLSQTVHKKGVLYPGIHWVGSCAGPRARLNVLQKKKTLAPIGIPTELSGCWKRRNLYKTVVVKSERMSQTRVQY